MSVFVLTLFCILFFVNFGNCNNKHMICKDVDDVFDDSTNTGIAARRLHGSPGKHGMKGIQGIQGIQGLPGGKGEPGNVDNERIEEIVRARVNEKTREMEIRIDELNEQIQNLTKDMDSVKKCVGVIYDNKCYWKEVHANADTTVAGASRICTNKNSKLVDIYSEEHYNMLMNYIRTDRYVRVWTGMRKQFKNLEAILSDGKTAPFTKPKSTGYFWNTAESKRTHVDLHVLPDMFQTDQGMGSVWPTHTVHGALCQSL